MIGAIEVSQVPLLAQDLNLRRFPPPHSFEQAPHCSHSDQPSGTVKIFKFFTFALAAWPPFAENQLNKKFSDAVYKIKPNYENFLRYKCQFSFVKNWSLKFLNVHNEIKKIPVNKLSEKVSLKGAAISEVFHFAPEFSNRNFSILFQRIR